MGMEQLDRQAETITRQREEIEKLKSILKPFSDFADAMETFKEYIFSTGGNVEAPILRIESPPSQEGQSVWELKAEHFFAAQNVLNPNTKTIQ